MLKLIRHYMWYFYFCVYWSAYNWGEKKNPQSNATNLFGFIWIMIASIGLQVILCFGYRFPGWTYFCIPVLPAFILPSILFKERKINSNRKEFDFLRTDKYKRKRRIVVASVIMVLILLNAGVAIYRNITNSL